MSTFYIYVHGTPRGHQIWGSEHSRDYISTFYNHDTQASEKVVLQIDVCGGDSFYTYLRQQNVYDVKGRPQAFFALTVGFRKNFCTNVYRLYQLFDAVYNQICVGSILKHDGNGDNYLVEDLTTARSGVNATVDKIQAAFTQKIEELIVPTLQSLSSGDTFNKTKKTISLLEVDSPLFIDYFKKYSVIVSPNMQPTSIKLDDVSNELKQVTAQKDTLSSANEQLQSDLDVLSKENKSLSNQLTASTSSTEKKYKGKIDQLKKELINVTNERDSLKQKIQEASSSIELIDQPFQKLTRLLAGRFHENHSSKHEERMEETNKVSSQHKKTVWRDWLNSILLVLVFVCCCVILVHVLRNGYMQQVNTPGPNTSLETKMIDETEPESHEDTTYTAETGGEDVTIANSDWEDCTINVIGSDKNGAVIRNQEYTVKVCLIGWGEANVPAGTWLIDLGDNKPINTDGTNSFVVPDNLMSGTNLRITYIYKNKPVVTRCVKVK